MRWRGSVAGAVLLLAACSSGDGRLRPAIDGGYQATGLASWYGEELAGRRTASGERFDPEAMTAAHRSLPFGTRVAVTALATGRTVVVRINDRGPYRDGRIIDLSRGAAHRIGIDRSADTRVRLRILPPDAQLGHTGRDGAAADGYADTPLINS